LIDPFAVQPIRLSGNLDAFLNNGNLVTAAADLGRRLDPFTSHENHQFQLPQERLFDGLVGFELCGLVTEANVAQLPIGDGVQIKAILA
jgi:hypothetical protein